jgi:hypothetical protein
MQIWANIQPRDDPASMKWNLSDTKCWKPFFHSGFPRFDYASVQVYTLYNNSDRFILMNEYRSKIYSTRTFPSEHVKNWKNPSRKCSWRKLSNGENTDSRDGIGNIFLSTSIPYDQNLTKNLITIGSQANPSNPSYPV